MAYHICTNVINFSRSCLSYIDILYRTFCRFLGNFGNLIICSSVSLLVYYLFRNHNFSVISLEIRQNVFSLTCRTWRKICPKFLNHAFFLCTQCFNLSKVLFFPYLGFCKENEKNPFNPLALFPPCNPLTNICSFLVFSSVCKNIFFFSTSIKTKMVLSMLQMHLQRQEDTGAHIWAIILHALFEVCVFQDQSYLNVFS